MAHMLTRATYFPSTLTYHLNSFTWHNCRDGHSWCVSSVYVLACKISCTQSQVDANAPHTRLSDSLHKAGVLPLFTSLKRKLWSLTSHYYLSLPRPALRCTPTPPCARNIGGGWGGVHIEFWHHPPSQNADNPKSLTADKTANLP